MIENVMNGIGGVGVFGIISICLFFAFFTGMAIWAASLKKSYLNSMRDLPLNEEAYPGSAGVLAGRVASISSTSPAGTPALLVTRNPKLETRN